MINDDLTDFEFESIQRKYLGFRPYEPDDIESIIYSMGRACRKAANSLRYQLNPELAVAYLDESIEEIEKWKPIEIWRTPIARVVIGRFPQPELTWAEWYQIFGEDPDEILELDFNALLYWKGWNSCSLELSCTECGWTCNQGEGHTTCNDGSCESLWSGHFKFSTLAEDIAEKTSWFVKGHLERHATKVQS